MTTAARVVAVGASAGGLEAFIDLLSAIPPRTGLAFVLVQHLDPHHESMLADILNRAAAIPVQQVTEGMRIERDNVYVIPPDREMTISECILRLAPRAPDVPHRPLDNFFRSLANDQQSRAIGVILSGNDADGSAGLQAIRDAGGVTFAQSSESAKFDVMPRSAAAAADLILPPREIAQQLVRVAQQYDLPETEAAVVPAVGKDADAFERIMRFLREKYLVDYRQHKQSSVQRRVLRRVLLGGFAGLADYADSLQRDPPALEQLHQDLLIGVTSFFREPEQFEALKTTVYPELVKGKGPDDTIRIWVAGCSTGEEVYSVAISLLEFLDDRDDAPRIVIYGSDINEKALETARAGFYVARMMANVSPARLARFFSETSGGYKISKKVRELCVFAKHDITRDPPYSRMDLVTCCNVLIYFGVSLQKKTISLFHYALAPGGFLMLGTSENLRASANLFREVATNPLIYRKLMSGKADADLDLPEVREKPVSVLPNVKPAAETEPHDSAESFLLTHLVPCGVLINDQMEVVRFRGDVSPYLSLSAGEATLNLGRLIGHREILAELRSAVRRSVRERVAVDSEDILVNDAGRRRRISFEVVPYISGPSDADLYWVLFHDRGAVSAPKSGKGRGRTRLVNEPKEVLALRQRLAAVVEDRERLAGEAAAAAEEAQSSDEELRSTNEELETAKEELQSANEELGTLNDELRNRNVTLTTMNDDLENLLAAVEVPILFVGVDLRIRRFNATARALLNLDADSAGQPMTGTKSRIDVTFLERVITEVIQSNTEADVEIQEAGGRWRLARIRPYRSSSGAVEGAIVALIDIDALKQAVLVAEKATANAKVLADASILLASSLDYEGTLESLTRLSTAAFSDWCAVDLVNADGTIRHLTVTHANPVLRELAMQFQEVAFSEPDIAPGAPEALRLRSSVLLSDIAESKLTNLRPDSKITQLIGALGVKSLISVPLIVRGDILGTMTFSSSRRRYESLDLQLAEELARRAATAIDTALLFREAEGANRYKDAFLGTVAHELRTPLTSILGWVQLVKQAPNLTQEALTQVEQSANLLRVFIEDLLDVARIREQKLRMELADVDFASVTQSACDITGAAAELKGVHVACEIALSPAPVVGDPVRLLQVVWNLLSNAIKFTPPEGSVEVRLDRQGNEARLSVHDTGAGISDEFLPHVFELFRQGEAVPGHSPGLGIGLAIVSQIVRLHGGTVRGESPGLGQGSTFTVMLPLDLPESKQIANGSVVRSGRRSRAPR
ncbi:MAG TPA: chemotaxis protein CheB [Thermoanaerobaculia bacterium]|nr:chemotaxis protein CheB [Thermoanaerobaculia bacterium]